jgi:hypothetical protein
VRKRLASRTAAASLTGGILVALAVLALSGCAAATEPEALASPLDSLAEQAQALLSRYDLHAAGPGATERITLSAPGQPAFALYARASADIGLPLHGCEGETVDMLTVPLTERSQAGDIRAYFVASGGKVVGAYLCLVDCYPGIVSLANRSGFLPPGLTPEHLTFDEVSSLEVIGPWSGDDWERRATYRDGADIARFTALLSSSTPRRGERTGLESDEEYMLILHYADGPEIRVRLVTKRDTGLTFLTFDTEPLWEWHFLPPAGLKAEVKSTLTAL